MATKKKAEQSEQSEQSETEIPAFINVINQTSATVFLESGILKPNEEGVATRAEYQNLFHILQRVD